MLILFLLKIWSSSMNSLKYEEFFSFILYLENDKCISTWYDSRYSLSEGIPPIIFVQKQVFISYTYAIIEGVSIVGKKRRKKKKKKKKKGEARRFLFFLSRREERKNKEKVYSVLVFVRVFLPYSPYSPFFSHLQARRRRRRRYCLFLLLLE